MVPFFLRAILSGTQYFPIQFSFFGVGAGVGTLACVVLMASVVLSEVVVSMVVSGVVDEVSSCVVGDK